MTIRHLRIFAAVYREGSITKAAGKLRMAQPGVSLAVKELEEEYHQRFFERMNRRLYVTEAGEQFYAYAVRIVELFDQMEDTFHGPITESRLNLGVSITVGKELLPRVLSRFRAVFPQCEIHVSVQNSQTVAAQVLANALDFGVIEDQTGEEMLAEEPFLKDTLKFVCSPRHPLAGQKKVTLAQICRYPFLLRERGSASREITQVCLREAGQRAHILMESVSNSALISTLQAVPGISVLPARLIRREKEEGKLWELPVCPPAFERTFRIIYHRRKYFGAPQKAMIALFKEEGRQDLEDGGETSGKKG